MDNDFFISDLLFKYKEGQMSLNDICLLFPKQNRKDVADIISNISYPINVKTFEKLQKLFTF